MHGPQEFQQAAAEPPASEPADDSQPNCGLSGEKFESFWDENHEQWRFRDAKRLTGEEAIRYLVHLAAADFT